MPGGVFFEAVGDGAKVFEPVEETLEEGAFRIDGLARAVGLFLFGIGLMQALTPRRLRSARSRSPSHPACAIRVSSALTVVGMSSALRPS